MPQRAEGARYFFSRVGGDVLSAGVEPPGANGLAGTGAFFGVFAGTVELSVARP